MSMKMDLNLQWGVLDCQCPHCDIDLELAGLPRWDVHSVCPSCNMSIYIHYDFIIMDDYEEWDLYEIKKEP